MGMVTSLGCDVATSCAAARAGLVRSQVLENYRVRSAVGGEEEPVIGHAATLLTRGFESEARLVRLLQGALTDLLVSTAGFPWREQICRCYMSIPHPRRTSTGLQLVRDENVRKTRLAAAETEQDGARDRDGADWILANALRLADWPGEMSVGFVSTAGHAGGVEAVRAAAEDLAAGRIDVAVVLAVDSLLDADTLNWLHICGRLKCDEAPAGLQPGEAAAALLLVASAGRVPVRRPESGAALCGAYIGKEARALLSGAIPAGNGLADVLATAWSAMNPGRAWIIADQNGEVYRATDWGHAVVRLRTLDGAFAAPTVWYPAASFGDTGAASALVGIAVTAHAFVRHYAPADVALIASASDGDVRGAIALGPSPGAVVRTST